MINSNILGKILYDNINGSNSRITLNDSVANYKYIEIYYCSSDKMKDFTKIYNPNNSMVLLHSIDARNGNSQMIIRSSLYGIVNNIIEPTTYANVVNFGQMQIRESNGNSFTNINTISIYRVIGYK